MYTITQTPRSTTPETLEQALSVLEYRQTPDGSFEEDGKHYGFKDKWFPVDAEVASTLIARYTELMEIQAHLFEDNSEAKDDILQAIDSLEIVLAEIQASPV